MEPGFSCSIDECIQRTKMVTKDGMVTMILMAAVLPREESIVFDGHT
jgi:hypothetical protein